MPEAGGMGMLMVLFYDYLPKKTSGLFRIPPEMIVVATGPFLDRFSHNT
jgi:hypothetical protein